MGQNVAFIRGCDSRKQNTAVLCVACNAVSAVNIYSIKTDDHLPRRAWDKHVLEERSKVNSFYQDRLGTNAEGETQKVTIFAQGHCQGRTIRRAGAKHAPEMCP